MSWYCIRVATRSEGKAIRALADLGLSAYCPMETNWITHARTTERKDRPLLPGYIFATLTDSDIWRVNRLDGVRGIIGAGGSPMPLPDRFIGLLAFHEWLGAFDRTMPYTELKLIPKPGMAVKVTKGPLSGALAVVAEGKHSVNRLRVLIDGFGRVREYVVKADAVEEASCVKPSQGG
jgi:transcription antitermination factor NusG